MLKFNLIVLIFFALTQCGRAYFPMEFKTLSRADRSSKQEDIKIKLIPLSKKSAIEANKVSQEKSNRCWKPSEAARLVEENAAIKEKIHRTTIRSL